MKKFAVLALTLAALALTCADAHAFGRRGGRHCGGFQSCGQPVFTQGCSSCGSGAVIVTSPIPTGQGEIRYFPQYQPATAQPLPVTTGYAAPVTTFSGCANGSCHTTNPGFFFRRR